MRRNTAWPLSLREELRIYARLARREPVELLHLIAKVWTHRAICGALYAYEGALRCYFAVSGWFRR